MRTYFNRLTYGTTEYLRKFCCNEDDRSLSEVEWIILVLGTFNHFLKSVEKSDKRQIEYLSVLKNEGVSEIRTAIEKTHYSMYKLVCMVQGHEELNGLDVKWANDNNEDAYLNRLATIVNSGKAKILMDLCTETINRLQLK